MRSAECGMRNVRASVVRRSTSHFNSAFRIPHSALGREGRGGEDRRRVRHAAPRLGGRRLQEGSRREGRGGGVRRGPGADGSGTRRADGRRRRSAGARARAVGQVPAETRVQWVRVVPRARAARVRSEEHTSELQSLTNLVCRLLLEKKKQTEQNKTQYMYGYDEDKPNDGTPRLCTTPYRMTTDLHDTGTSADQTTDTEPLTTW